MGDISAVLLKPGDTPLLQGTNRVTSQDCNRFLELPEPLQEGVKRCHQVQLTRPDRSLQYLNAAWEYDSVPGAEQAARLAAELPELGSVAVPNVEEIPRIGSYSAATSVRISSLSGEIYIRNIYWTHKNVMFRLTVISREPPSLNDLYDLAVLVEGRLPE